MATPNDSDLTSGEGSITIEITSKGAPITPDAIERARKRALSQRLERERRRLRPHGDDVPPDANPPVKPE
jgi:hypothetical protein